MAHRFTRRKFSQAAAAGSLGYLFTGPAYSVEKVAGANTKLRFAGVGIGGKGGSDIDQCANLGEIVALCDIDDNFLAKKTAKWKDAKVFHDYRKLFADDVMKNVDAVTVSTPDHHHALAAVLAMRMGKHVYVQKPLAHTVFEARLMREVAAKNKVCTQMGNQGTTENGLRRAVEAIQDGVIGDVKEVHVWTNRPVWPQAPEVTDKKMPKTAECPKNIHWEEFIGPAPMRPWGVYEPTVARRHGGRLVAYHDFHWRGWWDFGTGAIGDMACHTANMAFMACQLKTPSKISAEATDVNPQTCPSSAHVTFEFAAQGKTPAITLHWYEGQKDGKLVHPPEELVKKALAIDANPKRKTKLVNSGSIIVGSKGYIYSPSDYGAEVFIGPAKDFESIQMKKPEKLAINGKGDQGQKDEWVEAIKAGKSELALSNFDYATYLTESFLLGNVAIRSGKSFVWDGIEGKVKDCPEAEKLITQEYRKGWDLLGNKA